MGFVPNLSVLDLIFNEGVKPAIFEKRVSEAKRINKTEVQKITGKKRGPNQLVR